MIALADGTAVLIGGFGNSGHRNDVYQLTVSDTTATWISLACEGGCPSSRSGHRVNALADGTAVLFGGYDGSRLGDVCRLTVSDPTPLRKPLPMTLPKIFGTYSSLVEVDFCGFTRSQRCHCGGGGRRCEDGTLPGAWNEGGAFSCSTYEMLHGTMRCHEIKNNCCFCGGGTNTCEEGAVVSDCLTCAELSNFGGTAHCANDDIARACCCFCRPGEPLADHLVSTAEDWVELCQKTNLTPGGGMYRSAVLTFITPAMLPSSTAVT